MSAPPRYHRPGLRIAMRRDVDNPNRVVPNPHVWRGRRAGRAVFSTPAALRYARDQIAEWNGRQIENRERLRLSAHAQRLYVDLCNLALSRRSTGVLDLTYAQLQNARGVPLVEAVDETGDAAADELGRPIMVNDPGWGEGVRSLQRQLRELAEAGFVSIGYVINRNCGGHRLCVSIGGPDWFLAEVNRIEQLARAKGGRTSKPTPRTSSSSASSSDQPQRSRARSVTAPVDCARCGGSGWMEVEGDRVARCDHTASARPRAGPSH